MAPMSKTYPSEEAARRAVQALHAVGVPRRDLRLLIAGTVRDVRRRPRGGFAGPVARDAPVGSFAGPVRRFDQAPAASPPAASQAIPTNSARAPSRTPSAS
jgi:hypothetical protein